MEAAMGFESKLAIDHNIATAVREDGEYKITLTLERRDNKPITEREAQIVLTRNLGALFGQRLGSV
jgi:hypothetical protein